MFHIIHIPSNSPVLQKIENVAHFHPKYIYFPDETLIPDKWVRSKYGPAEFESRSRAKLFLSRFNKQQIKEFTIVEVTNANP